jgi:membrane protein YdbS with pleckstrin-like domain
MRRYATQRCVGEGWLRPRSLLANIRRVRDVAHGVFVHTETSVAFHRVQHIDVALGPVERLCGVRELVLNTSGTRNSQIKLPGLSRATAEALPDEIRQHIRADRE